MLAVGTSDDLRLVAMGGGPVNRAIGALLRPWVATCDETRERLSDHLEGELHGREAKRVLRHLARCPHCREALRTLARAVDGLRSLGRFEVAAAGPSVAEAVIERIRHDRR